MLSAPDFLCLIGLWGLRTHTPVFRHTSIKAEGYLIAGQLWILYTFNFHLSPSRALNHDNKWAIRLSWLMASITISWRYPPANLYLICESIYNLCIFKSMLGTPWKVTNSDLIGMHQPTMWPWRHLDNPAHYKFKEKNKISSSLPSLIKQLCHFATKGRVTWRYQNGWIFGKVPNGGTGIIFNPKIYVADFGNFK